MTWIRLKKSHTQNGKKFPVGRLMNKTTEAANRMVDEGKAELYNGPRPPQKLKIRLEDLK